VFICFGILVVVEEGHERSQIVDVPVAILASHFRNIDQQRCHSNELPMLLFGRINESLYAEAL